jgi:hypothetical protein
VMTPPDVASGAIGPVDCAFDVREIPFSMRGSWLDLSPVVGLHRTAEEIHLVSHVNGMHPVFALAPERDGRPVPTRWRAGPSRLEWAADDGAQITAAFDGPRTVRLRGSGVGMRVREAAGELTPFTGGYLFVDPVDRAVVLTSYETGRRYRISALVGSLDPVGVEALGRDERAVVLGGDGRDWEAEVVETTTGVIPSLSGASFEEVVAAADLSFASFLDPLVPAAGRTPAATLAAYTLWSATVAPEGMMVRESVLMSKHWMDKLWSWDHCFNALALAPALPDLALDQFFAPFDHQTAAGALPDSITHSEVLYNYVKPPIHGWAFRRLRTSLARPLTVTEVRRAYDSLSRWTSFWLSCRRAPGHPLPYDQHGNDSGWDNATTFDRDRVVEAPDLAAFLVLQLEVVADLGRELGLPTGDWERAREEVLGALLDRLWTDDGFIAVGALSGRPSSSTSLLGLLPLVLGERLPTRVRQTMIDLVGRHLTEHGLATEPVTSPEYRDDGYWRGPIWAPATALMESGLRESGAPDLADLVAARFQRLCERSGFAENFDAVSGAGLRDRAYTWTASVYLMLRSITRNE